MNGGKHIVFAGTEAEFIGNKKQIAAHFYISWETFRKKVNDGLDLDDAVIYCIIHQRKCYTVFPGTKREFTGNKREIAEHFEIDYEDFRKRTNNGLSFEEAIDKKIVKRFMCVSKEQKWSLQARKKK